jgi:O-antigen/teichoic acid export membrane protein
MNFKKLLAQSLVWRSLYFASVLLVNVFMSRFLKASGTGNLYYLSNTFSFVQIILSLSLESGITYYASSKTITVSRLLWLSVLWSLIVAGLVLAGSFYYQYYMLHTALIPTAEYCFFACCYITGLLLITFCSVLFYVQGDFITSNIILVLLNIGFLFTVPLTNGSANNNSIHTVMQRYFFVFLLQGIALVVAVVIKNKSWKEISLPGLKQTRQVLGYSLIAHFGNIIFFLVYRIDYWFVHANPAVCSASDLGNYIQVSKMGQLLLVIPQIIASVIFPSSASGTGRAELSASVMVITRLLSRFFLVAMLVVALFGKPLFIFVFGETFNNMQLPFIIVTPGIFCLAVLALLAAYFSGKGILRVNVIGNVIALVVVILGDFLLVPKYGIIGAAAVSTAGYFVNMLYSLRRFYKDYAVSWIDFFKWQKQDYAWLLHLLRGK